jgi:hypothetical protein
VDWLPAQCGGTRQTARATYRQFVAEGIRQPAAPWERVVGQISLGDEAFIHRAQRASRRTADPEIPRQQRQPAWLSPEAVLQQVALFGLRRWAGEALPSVARRMGVSYSAVSRRVSAVAQRLIKDRRFRTRVEKLSDVKVKT